MTDQLGISNQIVVRRKGSNIPFSFDRGDETIEGWVCTLVVKQFVGDTAIISRVINPSGRGWSGFLTSTETETMPAGIVYRIMAILTNATTDEEEQIETRVSITPSWA